MLTPTGEVFTLAGTGEVGSQDGPGAVATFYEPWALAVDAQGNVFIADTYNHKIRKLDKQGNVSTLAGSGSSGVVDGPANVARFAAPSGIAVDANGQLYVCDHVGHTIRKISPGGYVSTLAGTAFATGNTDGQGALARFNRPYGLDIDLNGNIFVADEWNHLIRKITPAGLVSTYAGTGILGSEDGNSGACQFNYPWDLAVDSSGQVFVMDGENHAIRLIDKNREVTTFAGEAGTKGAVDGYGSDASFNGATGIGLSFDDQELYIADAYNDLIRKVSVGAFIGFQILNATESDSVCLGESLFMEAFPPTFDRYEFFVNGVRQNSGTTSTFELEITTSGPLAIHVEGITSGGDRLLATPVVIWALEAPVATFSHQVVRRSPAGLQVEFEAFDLNAATYTWDFGDPSSGGANTAFLPKATHVFSTFGAYSVNLQVANATGCQDSVNKVNLIDFKEEITLSEDSHLFLPTAFTPNGDGLNDVLYLHAQQVEQIDFKIFNEWGEIIFRSGSLDKGWDGTRSGEPVQADTYLCLIRLTFTDGSEFLLNSPVTVLR
jgi:gliding motility-associated-like protein